MNYRKGVLPSDWYHATVETYETNSGVLTLVWTIDVGIHSFRHLRPEFKIPEEIYRLQNMGDELGIAVIENPKSELFYGQFMGIRGRIKTDRQIEGKFIKNHIIEYAPAQMPSEHFILREQTDEHFFENEIGRSLPF